MTSLRFFAAFLVLLFHALDSFPQASVLQLPRPILNVFESGFVGVSVFFILSGFILGYNYLAEDFTQRPARRRFWAARFARIYPVYLLGVVLAAPKFFAALGQHDLTANAKEAALTGGAVLTLTQAWLPNQALAWNPPGWSLSAEAFFYLLFPFVALRFAKLSPRGALVGLGACWLAALLPPVLYGWFAPSGAAWSAFVKFNPLLRLPEFLMGLCLAVGFLAVIKQKETLEAGGAFPLTPALSPSEGERENRLPRVRASGALGLVEGRSAFLPLPRRGGEGRGEGEQRAEIFGHASLIHSALLLAILIAIASLLCRDALPKHLFHNGLLDPAFAVIIFGLAWCGLRGNALNRFLSRPSLVLLGEASYALYILHVPLKGWLIAVVARWFPGALREPGLLSLVLFVYLALAVGAAVLSFRFIEVPARRWIKNWFARRPQRHVATTLPQDLLLAKGAKP